MVVCDDRDVMRLGPVKMLQAIQWATDLKGLSSSPAAWNYRAGNSAPAVLPAVTGPLAKIPRWRPGVFQAHADARGLSCHLACARGLLPARELRRSARLKLPGDSQSGPL
jgi:hypothetical protein